MQPPQSLCRGALLCKARVYRCVMTDNQMLARVRAGFEASTHAG